MIHTQIADLAARIADGTPIDWDRLASQIPDLPTDVVAGARLVERLAQVHASLPSKETFAASLFPPITGSLTDTGIALTPITWGPLTIQERLGHGTFGEVYRAVDRRLNRPVALKLLRHRDRRESAVIEEGHLMARVRHPNVVTVYGAERIDGRVGLWMEFVDGRTLEHELGDRGRFEADEVQRIGADLAAALGAVHRAGLLHRDVKAQNVMRDADGRVLLTDFGAGRDYTVEHDAEVSIAGTPLYLAPEVLDGHVPSPASDIYSLGVLLFHLATGSFPVSGRSLEELRDAHRHGRRQSLRSQQARLPARLIAAIERAVEPDPSRRFATAIELERALRPAPPVRWRALAASAAALIVVGVAAVLTRHSWLPSGLESGRHFTQLTPDLQAKFVFRGAAIDRRWMPCSPRGEQGVAICDLSTGSVEMLRRAVMGPGVPVTEMAPAVPAFLSPDGQTLAYNWEVTDRKAKVTTRTLRLVDANGGNDRLLYAPPGPTVLLKWMPDGRHLFVRETAQGLAHVLLIPVDGSPSTIIYRHSRDDSNSDLSPDLQTLVVSRRVAPDDRDLIGIDVASGSVRWRLEDPSDETFPKWTPDGRGLIFISDRAGGEHLMFAPVSSNGPGAPEVLRASGRDKLQPLAFGSTDALYLHVTGPTSTAYIANADLEGGSVERERPLDPRTIEDSMGADWSPDGDRYAYLRGRSNRSIAPPTIVIRDREGRTVREIHVGSAVLRDGSLVRWSPDGQRLAVVTRGQQTELRVIHLGTGDQHVLATEVNLTSPRWDRTGAALYYFRRPFTEAGKPGQAEIVRHELGGEPQRIYTPSDNMNLREPGVFDVARETSAIAVFVRPPRANDCVLRVVTADRSNRDFLIDQKQNECPGLAWIGSGPRLLYTKMISPEQSEIWLLDTESGDRRLLRTTEPGVKNLSIRADGKQLMFTAGNPRTDVWVFSGLSNAR